MGIKKDTHLDPELTVRHSFECVPCSGFFRNGKDTSKELWKNMMVHPDGDLPTNLPDSSKWWTINPFDLYYYKII